MLILLCILLLLFRENFFNDRRLLNCYIRILSEWNIFFGIFFGYIGFGYLVGFKRNEKIRYLMC